ncbi:hypothetical protein B296_00047659 [Ensete ventricosum]|uniref:Uncharacterized protein n=1 Tax=Ensete ventricosum TaxID=4639 RepID=A0A426YMI2_ENSVE|nr:hypothetical protein B296_00047659 [Ensete ventricosum]
MVMGMLLFNCREGIRQDFSPLHFGQWPVSSTTPPLARRSLPPFLPLRVFWRRLLISASSTGSVGSAIVAPRPTFWFSASEALLQASSVPSLLENQDYNHQDLESKFDFDYRVIGVKKDGRTFCSPKSTDCPSLCVLD